MTKYTRRQLTEAIRYWTARLAEASEDEAFEKARARIRNQIERMKQQHARQRRLDQLLGQAGAGPDQAEEQPDWDKIEKDRMDALELWRRQRLQRPHGGPSQRPGAQTRRKYLMVDRALVVLARLNGAAEDCAAGLQKVMRSELHRRQALDFRSRLFSVMRDIYGEDAVPVYPDPAQRRPGDVPRKKACHAALFRIFADEWKNRRGEMEPLCREAGLDGDAAAAEAADG